jgi:hypothetical protein
VNLQQLLESIADHQIINMLQQFRAECKLLYMRFDLLAKQHGYEYARKITMESIPDPDQIEFYLKFLASSNPKVQKTYENLIQDIQMLRAKINSGV